jgi:hypothetical protein
MARKRNNDNTDNMEDNMSVTDTTETDLDVEAVEPDADVEETDGAEATTEAKAPAAPKRGALPEGFVTPIGFAKIVGEKGLHTDRNGEVVRDVKPQMVYSYMKNSPKDDRLETIEIEDSNGVTRKVLKVDEAVAWWERKNERAGQRKANAAEKAQKAANRAKTSDQALVETGEADPSILESAEEAE